VNGGVEPASDLRPYDPHAAAVQGQLDAVGERGQQVGHLLGRHRTLAGAGQQLVAESLQVDQDRAEHELCLARPQPLVLRMQLVDDALLGDGTVPRGRHLLGDRLELCLDPVESFDERITRTPTVVGNAGDGLVGHRVLVFHLFGNER
jgi:hypothetical protein